MTNLKVGQEYQAKSYHESGYNFPEGKYKLKVQMEGFPQKPINSEKELEVAKQQWLEGLDGERGHVQWNMVLSGVS